MCGVPANSGGYCNKQNDSLINDTLTNSDVSAMYNWQDYLQPQLPVEYQPNGVYELTEIKNNLGASAPQPVTLGYQPGELVFREVTGNR